MRVFIVDERQVACHMGSWQPGQATIHQSAEVINVRTGITTGRISSAHAIFIAERFFLGKSIPVQAPRVEAMGRLSSAQVTFMAEGIFLGMSITVQAPFNAQLRTKHMAINKFGLHDIFLHSSKRFQQSLAKCKLSSGNSVKEGRCGMPIERLRMGSRRGGTRGRPASQRPAASPTASVDNSSGQNRSLRGTVSHNTERERGEILDCGHREHPAVRYRIPCTLENNTLIVSVTVEHCSDLRRPRDDLTVPRVDMQVPRVDMRRPTQAEEAGPSEPAQRMMRPDAEEDKKLKGLATDEPHLTDED